MTPWARLMPSPSPDWSLAPWPACAACRRCSVDHIWKVVRLRRVAYDGVALALVIAVLAGADTKPTVAFLQQRMIFVPFAAIAFFCAGYLRRAVTIVLRTRSTPHNDMRADAT